jgi:ribosome-binding protein aMBF1 (putative translation factor)
MMNPQVLKLAGKEFVVLERGEFNRLCLRPARMSSPREVELPPLPKPDSRGLRPAGPTLRTILARDIVKDRVAAGLSQRELARRAGIRAETLCRIESGQHTPTVESIERIDRALRGAGTRE